MRSPLIIRQKFSFRFIKKRPEQKSLKRCYVVQRQISGWIWSVFDTKTWNPSQNSEKLSAQRLRGH